MLGLWLGELDTDVDGEWDVEELGLVLGDALTLLLGVELGDADGEVDGE